MRLTLSLLFFFASSLAMEANDNWPQFRGPTGDGLSDSKKVPTQWSEEENVRWKTAIHDKGWSSPVIWGDQIWMTAAHTEGKETAVAQADFYAICVDRKKGAVVHDLKLFSEEKPAFCIPFNSYASPTPVIEEGRVYVHFGSHGTACIDPTSGKVVWERHDLKCNHFRGPGSSPILFGNLLILIFDGFDVQYVAALDKTDGKTVWKKDRAIEFAKDLNGDLKKAYATPSIMDVKGKKQLICPSAESTITYDPATGEELWRITHGGMNEAAKPVFGHGLIYLTSGHTQNLLAVNQGGSGKLTKDAVAWRINRGVPTRPSLLLVDDLLFMVNDNAIVSCLDAKTGKQHWQERLKGRAFSASPIYAAGNLYMADEDGTTHVLAAGTTFKLVAENKLETGCMASPAIGGNDLFLRTKTHLYCIGQ